MKRPLSIEIESGLVLICRIALATGVDFVVYRPAGGAGLCAGRRLRLGGKRERCGFSQALRGLSPAELWSL